MTWEIGHWLCCRTRALGHAHLSVHSYKHTVSL